MLGIPLTQGQVALIDDADYALVSEYRWYAVWNDYSKTFYAVRTEYREGYPKRQVYMHRVILGVTDRRILVDHKNHVGTDNSRQNIRACHPHQNRSNTKKPKSGSRSQFKGVHWDRRCNKWFAQIVARGKQIYLGICASELEAAIRYDNAARIHHGDFAFLNFPIEKEQHNVNADFASANAVDRAIGGASQAPLAF